MGERLIKGLGFFVRFWGEWAVGLGVGVNKELPLLKGWFRVDGFEKSILNGLIFFYCSNICAKTHTSSNVIYYCNLIALEYLGSSPLRYLTMVHSCGS